MEMTEISNIEQFTPSGKIVLRSVFKVPAIWVEPAPDPATGRFPDCVAMGPLTEKQKDSKKIFIDIDKPLKVEDGLVLDLFDPHDRAQWEAIQHSSMIAKTRYFKDELGNLVIDGNAKRYGAAEIYVEVPGNESSVKISKRKKQNQAETFLFAASESDTRNIAKLLGSNMANSEFHDIQEFLLDIAMRTPDAIIEAFTGEDSSLRLLLIDALHKGFVTKRNGLYQYGDSIFLGASQDNAILWMKDPRNKKLLDNLRYEVHPDWHEAPLNEVDVNQFAPIGSIAEVGASRPVETVPASKAGTKRGVTTAPAR